MKNKIYILTILIAANLLVSCNLDLDNPSSIASETFWTSEKDAWSNLNACYNIAIPGIGIYDEAFVDNVRCPYPWESAGMIAQQNGFSAQESGGYDFTGIRRLNNFIEKVADCPMDEKLKNRFIAEARTMRAMEYTRLTLEFGKVPLITETITYDAPNVKRDDVETVRKFILNELSEAAKVLPESYSGGYLNEKGRLTKYAAKSLKAQAALYFGDFKTAEQEAADVMQSGIYKLFTINTLSELQKKEADEMDLYVDFDALGIDRESFIKGMFSYEGIWTFENANPDNPEYIISRDYMGGNPDYADLTRYTSMRPDQLVTGWSSVVPQQNLIDAYWDAKGTSIPQAPNISKRASYYEEIKTAYTTEMKSGKTFREVVQQWITSRKLKQFDYMKEFRNRDTRLYASILFPFKTWYDTDGGDDFAYEWKKGAGNESTTGFNFRKMVAKNSSTILWGAYPCSESDYPSFRYAEILLIFAEARVYNSGYDAAVRDALNHIRARCGMPNVPSSLSKEEAIQFIRNERRIELAGEGQRYRDIRRYDKAYCEKYMNDVPVSQPDGEVVLTMKWDERMRLTPIPQQALDLNPLLRDDQNPGY